MSEREWNHVQTWRMYDHKASCGVEVAHHSVTQPEEWGGGEKHCWCVYAIIAEEHPLFDQITQAGELYRDDCIDDMPLHGGCTYHQWTHYVDWKGVTRVSKKVGCDYQHLMDEGIYDRMSPNDMGTDGLVFQDAKYLLAHLQGISAAKEVPCE